MRFGSAASGIEAASVAWNPLGFEAAWYSEIDPFCCALLRERHGTTPNLGDMNEITTHALRKRGKIDVLIAGTPCQAFSVAGRRGGLSDPRGQLALRLLDILEWTRPQWLVWENVPGVLSSGKGFDFAAFLWALAVRGYGFAWRVFDAQFSGVPQRRRRVFLVGHLGDWTRAASILFEPESLPGNLAASGETKQDIAGTITTGSGRRRGAGVNPSEVVAALTTTPYADNESHESKLVPVAYRTTGNCGAWPTGDKIDTLTTGTDPNSHVLAFGQRTQGPLDVATCLTAKAGYRNDFDSETFVVNQAVRRLTPRECERLMGLPDDYTLITYRGKPAADGPRYKAIGNSIAIPDLRWIGQRILNANG